MKKLLLLGLLLLSVAAFLSNLRNLSDLGNLSQEPGPKARRPILRVALVADSHNENELLAKALGQAQGMGINFVVGLGDYTNLGTIAELQNAKKEFDKSKLEYFVTAGDRDGWESRGGAGGDNFEEVFGKGTQVIERDGVQFVLLDNSDIYSGISQEDWETLKSITSGQSTTHSASSGQASTTGSDEEKARAFRDNENKPSYTRDTLETRGTLTFVFAHKTPFHPQSKHIMGEDSLTVAQQAAELLNLLEAKRVDGFFAGDLHFFARYNSPSGSVKISTIGAVASQRNFQGPRFGVLTVWDDWRWEVEEIEIR